MFLHLARISHICGHFVTCKTIYSSILYRYVLCHVLPHSYMCIHSSSMYATMFIKFIHIPKLTPTIVFINLHCSSTSTHIYHLCSSKFHPCIHPHPSISIHIHTHSSTFIIYVHSSYIHISNIVHLDPLLTFIQMSSLY